MINLLHKKNQQGKVKNFSIYRERRYEFDKKASFQEYCVDFYNSLIRAAFIIIKKNKVYKKK